VLLVETSSREQRWLYADPVQVRGLDLVSRRPSARVLPHGRWAVRPARVRRPVGRHSDRHPQGVERGFVELAAPESGPRPSQNRMLRPSV